MNGLIRLTTYHRHWFFDPSKQWFFNPKHTGHISIPTILNGVSKLVLGDSTYAFLFCDTRSCLGQENTQRYIIIWTIIQRSLYCHIIICMSALFLQVKSNNSKFALCLCMTASWHKQGTAATLVEITKDY